MKTFLLTLLASVLVPYQIHGFNQLDQELQKYYVKNNIKGDATLVDEYTWIRRIYLDLAGRIPTKQEIDSFVLYQAPDKKEKLIDKLLFSEDYVNNTYNFWADLFRIRPDRLSDDVGLLKSYPYMDYVRNFIRTDKSYKDFINSLLTAKGRYTDNPATGYMLRDNGMPLDNLATSLQLFVGKDIACAQCHDDPFQDYSQKQFYEMAAFFTTLDNREPRKEYGDILKRVDMEIKEITKQDRIDNNVRQLLSSNLFNLRDNDSKVIKLPHDYKYPDAKPFDVVTPISLDRKVKDIKEDKRVAVANWITNHEDFPSTIANRIWANIVGEALIQPETNFNINDYATGPVLVFLGNYLKDNEYSIKKLTRLITTSDFYSRVAVRKNQTIATHTAIQIKRMTPYQLWDSLLTLTIPDTNYTRISFNRYSDLIELNWKNINGKDLLERMIMIREYDKSLNDNFLKYKNIDLVRSAFILNRNGFVGQFIKEYGGSDRILIDSTNDSGSITQILVMMNSPVIELLSGKQSMLSAKQNKDVFLSILGRYPTIQENTIVDKCSTDDLIWSLINSKEFLFRK